MTESKEILRNIFCVSSDGIACVDLTGCFLFVNNSFANLLGYSFDEVKKVNIHQLMIGENGFNKLIVNDKSNEKFHKKKFIKKSGEVKLLQLKFWKQQNGLSDATIWLILKNINETEKNGLPLNKNSNEDKVLKITIDLQEQFKIISNCLQNLLQDLGGQIDDVDDYISFASGSCSKAKDLIGKLLEYSGMNKVNNNLNIICNDQSELSKQIN